MMDREKALELLNVGHIDPDFRQALEDVVEIHDLISDGMRERGRRARKQINHLTRTLENCVNERTLPVVYDVEELDALPIKSIVIDDVDDAWQRGWNGWAPARGTARRFPSLELFTQAGPLRIVYRAPERKPKEQ